MNTKFGPGDEENNDDTLSDTGQAFTEEVVSQEITDVLTDMDYDMDEEE